MLPNTYISISGAFFEVDSIADSKNVQAEKPINIMINRYILDALSLRGIIFSLSETCF